MKYIFVSVIFSALSLIASVVHAAPCVAGSCGASQKSSSGVRQYAAIGTRSLTKRVFDRPAKGWFTTQWNKTMGKAVNDLKTCAFDTHYPALLAKFRWSDAYVNDRIKPTRQQARDPNWSNYIWNQKETSADYVLDGISDALDSDLVNHGQGIAKLSVVVGLSATSDNLIPPAWMREDKSLTWVEGVNQNGKSDNWHARFDIPQAVDHAADFLAAFLAKFGNNKGLHSINLGEYYFGQAKYVPSGLDRSKYRLGVKNLWGEIVSSAPRDEDGNRVNIVQTNPLLGAEVTINDMERLGVGVSESDTNLDFPVTQRPETAALKMLYDRRKVHVMIDGDARYACQGRRQRWDGTPNPFGHKKGYSGVATPQEIFWYHGEQGPAPIHSFFMTISSFCDGAPQTTENFIDAIKQFGSCGIQATKWGAAPAVFPNTTNALSIVQSKPKPPEVVVN